MANFHEHACEGRTFQEIALYFDFENLLPANARHFLNLKVKRLCVATLEFVAGQGFIPWQHSCAVLHERRYFSPDLQHLVRTTTEQFSIELLFSHRAPAEELLADQITKHLIRSNFEDRKVSSPHSHWHLPQHTIVFSGDHYLADSIVELKRSGRTVWVVGRWHATSTLLQQEADRFILLGDMMRKTYAALL